MTYPKKIYMQAVVFLMLILLFFILIFGLSSYFSLRDITKYGIVVIFILGFLYYPLNNKIVKYLESLLYPVLDKKVDKAVNARRGYEGEDEVNSWLDEIVGKDIFIKNVQLPNCKFDIDAVVVSDRGVTVIEIKNLTNKVFFKNDEYYYEKDGGLVYLPPKKDPRHKLNNRIYALRNYLGDKGFNLIKLNKILVFSNGNVFFEGKLGTFIARNKDNLRDYLEKLEIDNDCTPEVCEKIKSLLKKHSKF
jgi:hypothetical protein